MKAILIALVLTGATGASIYPSSSARAANETTQNDDSSSIQGGGGVANGKRYTVINQTVIKNAPNYRQELARCSGPTGGQCSIGTSKTVQADVGTAFGVSDGLISAQFQGSFSSSRTVSVNCTSPKLKKGQYLVAYPIGTKWTYRVKSQDVMGMFEPKYSGYLTAFSPINGIKCVLRG